MDHAFIISCDIHIFLECCPKSKNVKLHGALPHYDHKKLGAQNQC